MYYTHLISIKKEYNLNLPLDQLEKLNDELCLIAPGNVISPRYLSRKLNIDVEILIEILTIFSTNLLITKEFMIQCMNEEEDEIDMFVFDTSHQLSDFLKSHNSRCPGCSSDLSLKRAFVTFKTKSHISSGVTYNESRQYPI